MSEVVRRRVLVAGRVQGVGYRAACARVATGLSVNGYVRNLDDGQVEVAVSGPVDQVERLIDWCRLGSRASQVDSIEVTEEEITTENARDDFFEVR